MKKILLVDDNEADRFLGQVVVQNLGDEVEIHLAKDGQEALDILDENNSFDLVLLDINMPKMDGHEFLSHHCRGADPEIPVIVMLTSSDQEEDRAQALKYKCVKDYMLKPVSEEKVRKLVELLS